jgi:hypothetical protein
MDGIRDRLAAGAGPRYPNSLTLRVECVAILPIPEFAHIDSTAPINTWWDKSGWVQLQEVAFGIDLALHAGCIVNKELNGAHSNGPRKAGVQPQGLPTWTQKASKSQADLGISRVGPKITKDKGRKEMRETGGRLG